MSFASQIRLLSPALVACLVTRAFGERVRKACGQREELNASSDAVLVRLYARSRAVKSWWARPARCGRSWPPIVPPPGVPCRYASSTR